MSSNISPLLEGFDPVHHHNYYLQSSWTNSPFSDPEVLDPTHLHGCPFLCLSQEDYFQGTFTSFKYFPNPTCIVQLYLLSFPPLVVFLMTISFSCVYWKYYHIFLTAWCWSSLCFFFRIPAPFNLNGEGRPPPPFPFPIHPLSQVTDNHPKSKQSIK